jgi:hypothetical protein
VIGVTVKPGAFDDWPKSRESLVKLRHLVRRESASLISVIAPGDRLLGESWGVSDMSGDGEGANNNRVLKLPAGSNTALELPFTGLSHPEAVAVDTAGKVYVADYGNYRVLKLPAA